MARRLSSLTCTACIRGDPDLPHSCWAWPDHLDYLSLTLAEVAAGRIDRLMIHAPPRHGKSTLISKWFLSWFFELYQHRRVILCSYEADFAARWGRQVRNTLEEYKRELTVRLARDSKANDDWETTEGGGMKTAGVGGPITGRGGDLMLLNDPIKNWEQASSEVYRDKLYEWWDTTFMTRAEPGAPVILEMTRWHEDDLAGRILASEEGPEWTVVNLTALAEEGDLLGRPVGAALWPDRYDEKALARVKRRSNYTWFSLYQGRPPSLQGSTIYYCYTPENNKKTFELRDESPLHLSIDFNIEPGMHGVVGQHWDADDEEREKLVARHVLHGPRWDTRRMMLEFGKLIERVYGTFRWPVLLVYGDPSGNSRWAGNGRSCWDVVRQALEQLGIPYKLRVSRHAPDVSDRVHVMNAALFDADGGVHYLVHPECRELIADFTRLKWDKGEISKKDKRLSHPSDAEGYRAFRLRPIRRLKITPGRVASSGERRKPAAAPLGYKTTNSGMLVPSRHLGVATTRST